MVEVGRHLLRRETESAERAQRECERRIAAAGRTRRSCLTGVPRKASRVLPRGAAASGEGERVQVVHIPTVRQWAGVVAQRLARPRAWGRPVPMRAVIFAMMLKVSLGADQHGGILQGGLRVSLPPCKQVS